MSASAYGLLNRWKGDVTLGYPHHALFVPNGSLDFVGFDTDTVTNLKIEVQNALFSADFDLSTNVAELRETFGMFASLFKSLRSPLANYKNLEAIFRREKPPFVNERLLELHRTNYTKFVKAYERAVQTQKNKAHKATMRGYLRDVTKVLADMRLTWRYGIQPLIFSIQDLIEISKKEVKVEFTKRETRSTKVDLTVPRRPETFVISDKGQGTRTLSHIERTGEAKVTVGAIARFRYKTVDDAFKAQFGMNPFITAYELIPLSFVVDWAIDIGSWLGSLQRPEAVVEVAGWVSQKVTSVVVQEFSTLHIGPYKVSANDFFYQTNASGLWVDSRDTFERTVWDPNKPLLPTFQLDMDQARVLDAIALLRVLLVK
jgi:hypothetical protein